MTSKTRTVLIEQIIKSVRKQIRSKRAKATVINMVCVNEAKPLVEEQCQLYGINPVVVLKIMNVYDPKKNSKYRTVN